MRGLVQLMRDMAYGVNAGNAIRHGAPVPPRPAAKESTQGLRHLELLPQYVVGQEREDRLVPEGRVAGA